MSCRIRAIDLPISTNRSRADLKCPARMVASRIRSLPKNRYAAFVLAQPCDAQGVVEPTLSENCSSSCRSHLRWRTSSNSHPTNSLSIQSLDRDSD